jgi:hypothetical protein
LTIVYSVSVAAFFTFVSGVSVAAFFTFVSGVTVAAFFYLCFRCIRRSVFLPLSTAPPSQRFSPLRQTEQPGSMVVHSDNSSHAFWLLMKVNLGPI